MYFPTSTHTCPFVMGAHLNAGKQPLSPSDASLSFSSSAASSSSLTESISSPSSPSSSNETAAACPAIPSPLSPRSPKRARYTRIVSQYFELITIDEYVPSGAVFQAMDAPRHRHAHNKARKLHCLYISDMGSRTQKNQNLDYQLISSIPSHRNILHYRDCIHDRNNGVQLLLSEYCVRGTARTLLERTSAGLGIRPSLKLFRGLLSGLSHAHMYGIAHSNLTLDNMDISTSGHVRLRGFQNNMSRIVDTDTETVPPECQHDLFLADSWAAGVILLQLLCRISKRGENCNFFTATNGQSVIDVRTMIETHPNLSSLHPMCKLLLSSLLQVNPTKRLRCQDALALCERALKQI